MQGERKMDPNSLPGGVRRQDKDGPSYEGVAHHVKAMAEAGDEAYIALWRSRTCFWCETPVDPTLPGQHRGRTFDHLVTKANRGGDEAENLRNCCSLCNHMRDQRDPADFRKVADMVIRPNRHDLVALGHALVDWGLVPEARIAWSHAGKSRTEASRLVYGKLGASAFDPSSKKGFEDLVSVLLAGHSSACADMRSEDLSALLDTLPARSDLRRARTPEAADAAARRDAAFKELMKRKVAVGAR
jgi:5-methylcytosine-specific restriction endonuclease McrA